MMDRWGLQGMRSFESEKVAMKEGMTAPPSEPVPSEAKTQSEQASL